MAVRGGRARDATAARGRREYRTWPDSGPDAVVAALQTRGLRGVTLDVTDPEPLPEDHVLWTLESALITPHTGGHTPKY